MKKSIIYAIAILGIGAMVGGVYIFWDKLPLPVSCADLPLVSSLPWFSEKKASLMQGDPVITKSDDTQSERGSFVDSIFVVKTLSGVVSAVDVSAPSLTISKGRQVMTVVLNVDTTIFDTANVAVYKEGEEENIPTGPETMQLSDIKIGSSVAISLQGDSLDDLVAVSVDVVYE